MGFDLEHYVIGRGVEMEEVVLLKVVVFGLEDDGCGCSCDV